MSKQWRWRNVPVPVGHVLGLLVGLLLHAYTPKRLAEDSRRVRPLGNALVFLSVLVIAWAVRTVGDESIDESAPLVTTGPYAYSRNPMYTAWMGLYLGLGVRLNSRWLLSLFPPVAVWTHAVVRREERTLYARLGEEYRTYRTQTPRYFSPWLGAAQGREKRKKTRGLR